MKVNQIWEMTNALVNEALGTSTPAPKDATGFVSLGKTVLSSDKNKDKFLDTLFDRIGKTIISVRPFKANTSLMKHSYEWGAILQKLYVDLIEAESNGAWELANGTSPNPFTIKKPTAKQKLFTDINTWAVKATIPDDQMFSAFDSATAMEAFINAIYMALETSMEVRVQLTEKLCYANFIAEKLAYTATPSAKGLHAINLLTDYTLETGIALTAVKAMTDTNFLKYATAKITFYLNAMANLSQAFNTEQYSRHTPKEYSRVSVLSEFAMNCKFYLQSDTYHKDLVELPNYEEVTYWQAPGDAFLFEDTSKVQLSKTSSGAENIIVEGVVAVITDVEAVGVTINKPRTVSQRNNIDEYTNVSYKANIGFMNDMSENGLVFIVADV